MVSKNQMNIIIAFLFLGLIIYTKFENGSIAMESENASMFVPVESTGLQKFGL